MVDIDPTLRHSGDLHPVEKEFICGQLDLLEMRSVAMRANLLHPHPVRDLTFAEQMEQRAKISERVDRAADMDETFGLFVEPGIGNLIGSADLSSVSFGESDEDFEKQKQDFRDIQTKYGIVPHGRQTPLGNPKWGSMDIHEVNGQQMAVLVRERPVGTLVKPDRFINVEKRSLLLARNIDKFKFLFPDDYVHPPVGQPQDYFLNPNTSDAFDPRKLQYEIDKGYSPDLQRMQIALFAYAFYPDYRG